MFNIGAVSRMTNILEATLRVWERRYNFPRAARTDGGHRLYSQQDVSRLQWVKTRIDEGVQVSHAIRALQRAEQDGTFVPVSATTARLTRPLPEGATLPELQAQLYNALVAHDLDEATLLIGEAHALYPLEEIILHLVSPTLNQIGAAWEHNEIGVATEHLATNHIRNFLWVWMRVGPPAYPVNPVVLACAPGELHEVSLLMMGVLLRRLRWPVLYLGQSMPLENLSIFIEDLSPSIVVFVAMTETTAQDLLAWPTLMPEIAARGRPHVCFGGNAFVDNLPLQEQMQGHYLGDSLPEGVQNLNTMLHQLNPMLQ